jgi:hypothetical protein
MAALERVELRGKQSIYLLPGLLCVGISRDKWVEKNVAGRAVLQIRVVVDEGGGVRQRRSPKEGRWRVFVGVVGEGEGGDGVYLVCLSLVGFPLGCL